MSRQSAHDAAVLDVIFNPLLPAGQEIPKERPEDTVEAEFQDNSDEANRAKELELEGVKSAEANDFDAALNYFNQAVSLAPNRASCYNNRAQALRLRGDVDGALEDLNKAIELSQGTGKAACQAYTQRGLIYRLEKKDDEALADFKRAANLGSPFARTQVIQMNPYAAMCNQMLTEVMGRLREGKCQE
ncbi:tetratricopeptide repeat protein 36 homolog [Lytechinus pictus]|uniref:tetratricopeptide repeat protein 36 homolog n=1 Tax=Lytechinus pictus TaxID=7653 RepID=UPI0030BA0B01